MTINERLIEMLAPHSQAVKNVLLRVIVLEQENISKDRPRLTGDIDNIIDEVSRSGLGEEV